MRQLRLKGQAVSPGIALGQAFILEQTAAKAVRVGIADSEVDDEIRRFHAALARSREQLQALKERMNREVGGEHSWILDAQLLMLQDNLFIGQTEGRIRTEKVNVEWALQEVQEYLDGLFKNLDDAYIAERSSDIGDVVRRVHLNLGHLPIESMTEMKEHVVLVARDLTPSQAAQIDKHRILGCAIDTASRTSHAIILARSLKIPAVIGLHDFYYKVRNNDWVLVDGTEGEVVLNPPATLIKEYLKKKQKYEDYQRELVRCAQEPSITQDGVYVVMQANVELVSDIPVAVQCGAEGIGLFRTEYLILTDEKQDPDEEKQYGVYCSILRGTSPHAAVIRTADLGGDKLMPAQVREPNPILGLRAVRLSLRQKDFFKRQLRALHRAGTVGNLRILIPMISGVAEVRQVKKLVEECKQELAEAGKAFAPKVPIGIMIETPAAVTVADLLAREVDFFSIGTNDLIQHTLAVDRDNDSVSYLYEPLHPAILRSLRDCMRAAAEAGIGVSLCGEAAAEPLFALIMLGLGLREFSMNPTFIPVIKHVVRAVRADDLRDIACEALLRPTAQEVEEFVLERLVSKFPDAVMALPGGYGGE
ncbi:MAG: phosphoenolpyruvate--protein phosphotransferase [Acidobacteriota bacterium]